MRTEWKVDKEKGFVVGENYAKAGCYHLDGATGACAGCYARAMYAISYIHNNPTFAAEIIEKLISALEKEKNANAGL